MENKNDKLKKIESQNITDQVLTKIKNYQSGGLINLPKDYSAENALKGAWIILQDVKTKDGKIALDYCSKESIALALLKMVTEGLSPIKKHGSFIPRGTNLNWEREYDGDVLLANRAGLEWIRARVIYKDDVFEYEIGKETGAISVLKHEQKLENIDINKIRGVYVIYKVDGVVDVLPMTMKQIEESWSMGSMKGNSQAHKKFTDQMAIRTVIRRACKPIIRRSDDNYLFEDEQQKNNNQLNSEENTTETKTENISFEEVEVVTEQQTSPDPKEEIKKPETVKSDKSDPKDIQLAFGK